MGCDLKGLKYYPKYKSLLVDLKENKPWKEEKLKHWVKDLVMFGRRDISEDKERQVLRSVKPEATRVHE